MMSTSSTDREPPLERIVSTASRPPSGEVEVRADQERRRALSAFLLQKRQRVDQQAKTVGPYLRRENRVGRPFTQEEVAEALEVSRQWYAALEMGSSVRPSPTLVDRIATLFVLRDEERITLFRLAIREFAAFLKPAGTIMEGVAPVTAYAAAVSSPAEIDGAAYELARIREHYLSNGHSDGSPARPRIVASWNRCRAFGVDPNRKHAPMREDLAELRAANERLLRAADPVVMYLADQFAGTGYVIVVTDAHGHLLDLAGDLDMRRRLARIEFEPGGDWSEAASGTNAVGTAIADQRPFQLLAAEHFCDAPLGLTCTAAPVWAPGRRMAGVLDITGAYDLVRPHLVGVVMQAALEIEERLAQLECPVSGVPCGRSRVRFRTRTPETGH
jgi:transcriptional regulator with XRE-family HTH domain